jgi:hypothetical protein
MAAGPCLSKEQIQAGDIGPRVAGEGLLLVQGGERELLDEPHRACYVF